MKYEYNGHLLEEDRINLVASEIVQHYPQIDLEKAKEAAMIEGRLSNRASVTDVLNRLYNIMLVNSKNKNVILPVYREFLNLLQNNIENTIYSNIIEDINQYFEQNGEFPLISDYL